MANEIRYVGGSMCDTYCKAEGKTKGRLTKLVDDDTLVLDHRIHRMNQ
jgi:hypothetical protein